MSTKYKRKRNNMKINICSYLYSISFNSCQVAPISFAPIFPTPQEHSDSPPGKNLNKVKQTNKGNHYGKIGGRKSTLILSSLLGEEGGWHYYQMDGWMMNTKGEYKKTNSSTTLPYFAP
jgi:hypothetical protein